MVRQKSLCDRRLFELREQYMQLYHEDGYCCGPLAADAIRVRVSYLVQHQTLKLLQNIIHIFYFSHLAEETGP